MLHTHTHPVGAGSTLKGNRKKKTDTRRADGQKLRRGGRGTDGPPEPTYTAKRAWPKTAHTPKPHDALRRGTQGELGTKWGTSWWQTKPKQVVNKQDSVPKPKGRAIVPQQARVQVSHKGINTAIKFQRIRCRKNVSPHQKTIKRKKGPHLQVMGLPAHCIMTWCLYLQKMLRKGGLWSSAQLHLKEPITGIPGKSGAAGHLKRLMNGKSNCYTLLQRITNSKGVNSVFKSVDIDPAKEVASFGPMAPCRSHHRNHTRQEWIIIWSGRNWILKHANQPRSEEIIRR